MIDADQRDFLRFLEEEERDRRDLAERLDPMDRAVYELERNDHAPIANTQNQRMNHGD